MFTCACALFGFVVSANAAPAPGDRYVTISYTVTGPGTNKTTYYLAVNGDAVTTVQDFSEDNCLWIQTTNNAFWSVAAEQYLTIEADNSPVLMLQGTLRNFTIDGKKMYFVQKSSNKNYHY
jgi:hypothetical protein